MNEPFILPVIYQGTELEFKARFERWGYTHRIAVLIDENTFIFEPDEEGAYRALNLSDAKTVNEDLLRVVAEKLVKLTN